MQEKKRSMKRKLKEMRQDFEDGSQASSKRAKLTGQASESQRSGKEDQ